MAKPVPAITAELTVTGEVPVEVSTRESALAVFTVTLPKARLVELTVSCGLAAASPVPFNATTIIPLMAELLPIRIFPLAAPMATGLNCTWSVTDCWGLSVAGRLPPTMAKPVPVIVAELTVTGEVPVEVSVSERVVAAFTAMLPKLREVALKVNCAEP